MPAHNILVNVFDGLNLKNTCGDCPVLPKYSDLLHEFAASLGKALDARDWSTKEHSNEVADISSVISVSMGFTPSQTEVIHLAGHLHDIGKIGIPDSILFKKAKLDQAEWECIKKHPETGAEIVSSIKGFNEKNSIKDIILHHHERFDGGGYPYRLKGFDIPLGARIVAVADTVSAMMQNRPYRKKLDFDYVVKEINNNSGTQFDPEVVDAFMRNINEIFIYFENRN